MNSCSLPFRLMACVIALAAAGCNSAPGKPGPGPETPRPEQVLGFATLYRQNCSACHGVNGKNAAAIPLANPAYLALAGDQNIERVTANGVPGTAMPPFGKAAGGMLTDQQIAILAQGMEQAWGNPATLAGQTPPPYASATTGDAAHGQQAFTAHGCIECHGVDATGGKSHDGERLGSLVDPSYLALVTDQGLRSFILAGQTDAHDWRNFPTVSTAHPLTDQDTADIVAWLASHRTATPGQVYKQHP